MMKNGKTWDKYVFMTPILGGFFCTPSPFLRTSTLGREDYTTSYLVDLLLFRRTRPGGLETNDK